MILRVFSLILFAAVFMGTVACDEALSSLTGPTPDLEPTFSSIQSEVFQTRESGGRPACTECHNAVGGRFNGLDLSSGVSHTNLVGAASRGRAGAVRVIAGDPENSYLIHKLEGRADRIAGVRMPLAGPYLSDGQMLVIKRWIALGARND